MLLTPDHTWEWFFDNKHQRLALAIGQEWMFLSAFTAKQLNPDCQYRRPFSAEHAKYLQQSLERLSQQIDGTDDVLAQAALNMVVAKFFSIPMMPKSWYFSRSATIVYGTAGKTVLLQTSLQQAQFVVVENNDQSSLMMLIDGECQLSDTKCMHQFGLIKVMNDRLMPAKPKSSIAIVAA